MTRIATTISLLLLLLITACSGPAADVPEAPGSAESSSAPGTQAAGQNEPQAALSGNPTQSSDPGPELGQPTTGDADPPPLADTGVIPDSDPVLVELRALGARFDSLAAVHATTLGRLEDPPAAGPEEALGGVLDRPELRNLWTRVFWTLVVLMLTAFLVRSVAFVLDTLAERNAERRLFYKRLVPLVRLLSWIIAGVVVARVVWSVDAQGLLAAGAAGAVAIGFAAQDILKNVFGGLVIVADRPFAAGDKIRVGNTYGEVVSVGLWSTRITTPDDSLVSVPNSQIVNGQVANANSGALDCQVVTDLFVPGWVDERLAKKIAYEAAAASPFVYLNKPIVVLVRDQFQDTFVTNLKVKAYVLDQRYEFRFMSDVTERARHEFRKHGLLGPFHGAKPVFRIDQGRGEAGPVSGFESANQVRTMGEATPREAS